MRPHLMIFLFFVSLAFPVNHLCAMERFEIITTMKIKELIRDKNAGKSQFILINALDSMIFRDGAIPGSINIPLGHLEENIALLGNDKSQKFIIYCRGFR